MYGGGGRCIDAPQGPATSPAYRDQRVPVGDAHGHVHATDRLSPQSLHQPKSFSTLEHHVTEHAQQIESADNR